MGGEMEGLRAERRRLVLRLRDATSGSDTSGGGGYLCALEASKARLLRVWTSGQGVAYAQAGRVAGLQCTLQSGLLAGKLSRGELPICGMHRA